MPRNDPNSVPTRLLDCTRVELLTPASLEGLEKVTTISKAKEENAKRRQVKCSVSTVTAKTDPVTTDMMREQIQNIDLQNTTPKDMINLGKMVVEKRHY